ncbi:synaptonemal complex protein 3-like isoform X1 [Crotalus tigris]|uniref:synaptonemal complex protein 3-like isoform X1 n=1 Tax=Crotalus tigris TaxID=88082 RepID=UPI00192F95F7|nr:synaptonemal complex protein 3-like isoform X1 [Crotalus tigris]
MSSGRKRGRQFGSEKIMAPSGRKSTGKTTKLAQEDSVVHVYNFEDDPKKHLSGSDEDIREEKCTQKIMKAGWVILDQSHTLGPTRLTGLL